MRTTLEKNEKSDLPLPKAMPPKADKIPESAFGEPSEPSALKPADKPKEQLTNPQEENPQVVVTESKKASEKKEQTSGKIKSKL